MVTMFLTLINEYGRLITYQQNLYNGVVKNELRSDSLK
jgi:hypothetical protein